MDESQSERMLHDELQELSNRITDAKLGVVMAAMDLAGKATAIVNCKKQPGERKLYLRARHRNGSLEIRWRYPSPSNRMIDLVDVRTRPKREAQFADLVGVEFVATAMDAETQKERLLEAWARLSQLGKKLGGAWPLAELRIDPWLARHHEPLRPDPTSPMDASQGGRLEDHLAGIEAQMDRIRHYLQREAQAIKDGWTIEREKILQDHGGWTHTHRNQVYLDVKLEGRFCLDWRYTKQIRTADRLTKTFHYNLLGPRGEIHKGQIERAMGPMYFDLFHRLEPQRRAVLLAWKSLYDLLTLIRGLRRTDATQIAWPAFDDRLDGIDIKPCAPRPKAGIQPVDDCENEGMDEDEEGTEAVMRRRL